MFHGANTWQFSISFADSQLDVDSQPPENHTTETQNPRKRPAGEMEEENDEDLMDQLLPAAAAMKRRRIEEEEEAARTGKSTQRSFGHIQEEPEAPKPKKPKKELNIKETVRSRREAEDIAAIQEEEELRDTIDGVDVDGMRNLAVIEEMDLPDHTGQRFQRQRPNGTGGSNRWDDRWNGRKNFKKFHRQGEGGQPRRGQSVMVPLEEVKKKDYGIGEEYWLESNKTNKRQKAKERASQSQSQPFATARSQREEEDAVVELGDGEDTGDSRIQQSARGKRKEPPDRARAGVAKKQKFATVKDSESESEDELRFRFKKRR